MNRTLSTGALLVFAAMSTACSFKLFEDIGSDPHPPSVEVTAIRRFNPLAKATPRSLAADAGSSRRAGVWDSGGFTLPAGEKFEIDIAYADAGGDILKFVIRDRDGAASLDVTPTDQTYFSGTAGVLTIPADGLEVTGVAGPHRMEVYAEDSHLTRSEKVEFVITLVY